MMDKQGFLDEFGYAEKGWTVDSTGRLICPHGYACEDDQRNGLGECGCVSPMVEALGI